MKVGKHERALRDGIGQETQMKSQNTSFREQVLNSLERAAKSDGGKISKKEIIAAAKKLASAEGSGVEPNSFLDTLREELAILDLNGDKQVSLRKANKALKRATEELSTTSDGSNEVETSDAKFEKDLKTQIKRFSSTGDDSVTERQLFASLTAQGVEESGGKHALLKFYSHFNEHLAEDKGQTKKGLVYAANRALKDTRVEGFFLPETAHEIRSRAFGMAQLDQNRLFLGNVSPKGDFSFNLETALAGASLQKISYDQGTEQALTRPERRALKRELLGKSSK